MHRMSVVMDDNIIQEVVQSLATSDIATGEGRHKTEQLLQFLKTNNQGWKIAILALRSDSLKSNHYAPFTCFSAIQEYLEKGYRFASPDDREFMKEFVKQCFEVNPGSAMIMRKEAQILSLVFVNDYLERWRTFIPDVFALATVKESLPVYLCTLSAIADEVADRETNTSPEVAQRNTQIKDAMRLDTVECLCDSLLNIMVAHREVNPSLTALALDALSKYISWIDIKLVTLKFFDLLISFLAQEALRVRACDCILEIVNKGMDPLDKVEICRAFLTQMERNNLLKLDQEDDTDFKMKVAALMNGMGVQLISGWKTCSKNRETAKVMTLAQSVKSLVDYLLQFLKDEDDDVSGNIIPFAQEYVNMLKVFATVPQDQMATVKELLRIVVMKMTYDDDYNFDSEGEDEGEFQRYRKSLKNVFNNIAQLDSAMLIESVHAYVTDVLLKWQTHNFREVELAIRLLYMLGEAVPASQGQHFTGNPAKVTALQSMMRQLMTCGVSTLAQPVVQIQFFETVVRYDRFFQHEPEHVQEALAAFLDQRGLRNPSPKVRSRTAYLFSRFIKSIKGHMQGYHESVLERLTELLVLNPPNNGHQALFTNDEQVFLYETTGILVVNCNLPSERKRELMRSLLLPLAASFKVLYEQLLQEPNPDLQVKQAQCIVNAMNMASRISKGFTSQQTMQQNGCLEVFQELLEVFLQALRTHVQRQTLHAGVRQFIHRMVVCMEGEVLKHVSTIISNLLQGAEVKDLTDFFPLINQLTMKFKRDFVPILVEVFGFIYQFVQAVVTAHIGEEDRAALEDRQGLEQAYFNFISTLVFNDATDVLSKNESILQGVLDHLVTAAATMKTHPTTQKCCMGILRKLVETWGGHAEFMTYVYGKIVPACIFAPLDFNLKDAQANLALGEFAACLKSVYEKEGDKLLNWLMTELSKKNLPGEKAQEFCCALKLDMKEFKKYMKTFYSQVRS